MHAASWWYGPSLLNAPFFIEFSACRAQDECAGHFSAFVSTAAEDAALSVLSDQRCVLTGLGLVELAWVLSRISSGDATQALPSAPTSQSLASVVPTLPSAAASIAGVIPPSVRACDFIPLVLPSPALAVVSVLPTKAGYWSPPGALTVIASAIVMSQ